MEQDEELEQREKDMRILVIFIIATIIGILLTFFLAYEIHRMAQMYFDNGLFIIGVFLFSIGILNELSQQSGFVRIGFRRYGVVKFKRKTSKITIRSKNPFFQNHYETVYDPGFPYGLLVLVIGLVNIIFGLII